MILRTEHKAPAISCRGRVDPGTKMVGSKHRSLKFDP